MLSDTDEEEFSTFARLVTPVALRVVRRISPPGSDTEAVVAEAIARAFLHWARLRTLSYREAWFYRVATNLSLDATRRRRFSSEVGPARSDSSTQFEDRSLQRMELKDALLLLSNKQRQAVVLRYLLDLPVNDVASAMRLRSGTVRKHLERGLTALRSSLGTDPDEVIRGQS